MASRGKERIYLEYVLHTLYEPRSQESEETAAGPGLDFLQPRALSCTSYFGVIKHDPKRLTNEEFISAYDPRGVRV